MKEDKNYLERFEYHYIFGVGMKINEGVDPQPYIDCILELSSSQIQEIIFENIVNNVNEIGNQSVTAHELHVIKTRAKIHGHAICCVHLDHKTNRNELEDYLKNIMVIGELKDFLEKSKFFS